MRLQTGIGAPNGIDMDIAFAGTATWYDGTCQYTQE
jgi:hypothetical protein